MKLGELIAGRWKTIDRLGKGTFCEILLADDIERDLHVAVKIENEDMHNSVLQVGATHLDVGRMKVLSKIQVMDRVPRHYHYGKTNGSHFIAMQYLKGLDMSEFVRKLSRTDRLPVSISAKLCLQILRMLQDLHELGFIHRDVKPNNFVADRPSDKISVANFHDSEIKFYMIDFGLSRQFISDSGDLRPPRERAEFRGTSMYAAWTVHEGHDQSQKEDLYSMMYVLLDLTTGGLPWEAAARDKDKQTVWKMKRKLFDSEQEVQKRVPQDLISAWTTIMKHLGNLKYGDKPDYSMIEQELERLIKIPIPPELLRETEQKNGVKDEDLVSMKRKRTAQENELEATLRKQLDQCLEDLQKCENDDDLKDICRRWRSAVESLNKLEVCDVSSMRHALQVASLKHWFFLVSFEDMSEWIKTQKVVHILENRIREAQQRKSTTEGGLARSEPKLAKLPPIETFEVFQKRRKDE